LKVWDARTGQQLLDLRGHTGRVSGVAFSPDGKRLASGSMVLDLQKQRMVSGELKVWDAQTGGPLLTLRGLTGPVCSVAFSPDGKRLAGGSGDARVQVWDAQTGQQVLDLQGHTNSVWSVCFSPDGARLATGSNDGTVKVWDRHSGQQLRTFHTGFVTSVAFSPDGARLATGSYDHTLKVWDARTGQQLFTLQGHAKEVSSVAFSPDGTRLASGSWDTTVKVWDANSSQQPLTLTGHASEVRGVAFSPDGKRLASGSGPLFRGEVKVWDAQTGQQLLDLKGHTGDVTSMAFSPDGTRIASGSGVVDLQKQRYVSGELKVWDAQTGRELLDLQGHTGNLTSVAFSPDGQHLASGSEDQTVKVWDAQTGRLLRTLQGHTSHVTSVVFSPDGQRLASGSEDQTVKVWDAQTGRLLRTLQGHTSHVLSVSFRPDSQRLASGSFDNTVKVWDVGTGQQLLSLQGHTGGGVNSVTFISPGGKRLASGSHDQTVKVWDAETGQELLSLKGHTGGVLGVAVSPDGQRLASGSRDGTVKVWGAHSAQQLVAFKGHPLPVSSVAFSPDGQRVVSGSPGYGQAGEVKVWDAQTGQELLDLKGHTDRVTSVAFSADGQRVIAASAKGEVRAWDAQGGRPILPCTDPAPPPHEQALSPDGRRLVRLANFQPVVGPRVLPPDDGFNRRLHDQAREHLWHLHLAREARQADDAFALAFHLRPLLLTAFLRWRDRPHDSFPLWAWRPPLIRKPAPAAASRAVAVTEAELRRLLDELDRQVQAEPKAWQAWAGRGWCRHLLGDADGALADLKQAGELRRDEPGLWALRGSVALRHQRADEAETVRRRLADWPGVDVAVWHSAEAEACEAEGALPEAQWHLNHLLARAPSPVLLARRGHLALALGQEKEAAADFARALQAKEKDVRTLWWHARASLATGDREAYRRSCAALLRWFDARQQPQMATAVARTAMLAADAGADPAAALKLLPPNPQDAVTQTTRGGLLLRAGKHAEAVAELRKAAAQTRPDEPPVAGLLLAIALQRQGEPEQARRAFERARFVLEQESSVRQALALLGGGAGGPLTGVVAVGGTRSSSPPRWDWAAQLEVRLFRREAEALLSP
jgi:WD40 repeat protein/predicted Zn-dependent protease